MLTQARAGRGGKAKVRKRKGGESIRLVQLLDANKDAIRRGGTGAPRREILAYPIEPPEDDLPF